LKESKVYTDCALKGTFAEAPKRKGGILFNVLKDSNGQYIVLASAKHRHMEWANGYHVSIMDPDFRKSSDGSRSVVVLTDFEHLVHEDSKDLTISESLRLDGNQAFKSKNYYEAHNLYMKALAGYPQTEVLSVALLNLVALHVKRGSISTALAYAVCAQMIEPNPRAYVLIARAMLDFKKNWAYYVFARKALADKKYLLKTFLTDECFFSFFSKDYYTKLPVELPKEKDTVETEEDFVQSVGQCIISDFVPNDSKFSESVWYLLHHARNAAGKGKISAFAEAIEYYQAVVNSFKPLHKIFANLGAIYQKENKLEQTILYATAALVLEPSHFKSHQRRVASYAEYELERLSELAVHCAYVAALKLPKMDDAQKMLKDTLDKKAIKNSLFRVKKSEIKFTLESLLESCGVGQHYNPLLDDQDPRVWDINSLRKWCYKHIKASAEKIKNMTVGELQETVGGGLELLYKNSKFNYLEKGLPEDEYGELINDIGYRYFMNKLIFRKDELVDLSLDAIHWGQNPFDDYRLFLDELLRSYDDGFNLHLLKARDESEAILLEIRFVDASYPSVLVYYASMDYVVYQHLISDADQGGREVPEEMMCNKLFMTVLKQMLKSNIKYVKHYPDDDYNNEEPIPMKGARSLLLFPSPLTAPYKKARKTIKSERRCFACKSNETLWICGNCKGAYYCSQECQANDVSDHQLYCQTNLPPSQPNAVIIDASKFKNQYPDRVFYISVSSGYISWAGEVVGTVERDSAIYVKDFAGSIYITIDPSDPNYKQLENLLKKSGNPFRPDRRGRRVFVEAQRKGRYLYIFLDKLPEQFSFRDS
jgi:tetratricopeptide (TPR) repeat protein